MTGLIILVFFYICYKYIFKKSSNEHYQTYLALLEKKSKLPSARYLSEHAKKDLNLENVIHLINLNTQHTSLISSPLELKNAQIDFDQKIGLTYYIKTKFPTIITSETMRSTLKEIIATGFVSNLEKHIVSLEDNYLIIRNESTIVYKSLYKSYYAPKYELNIPANRIDRKLDTKYLEIFKPGLWIIDFIKEVNIKYNEADQIALVQRDIREKQQKAEIYNNFSPA